MSEEFDNEEKNKPDEAENSSQYRMSFERENKETDHNDNVENPYNAYNNYRETIYEGNSSNGGNNGNKGNKGPIVGLIIAALVLALIVGGLFAAAKLFGTDKEKPQNQVATTETTTAAEETGSGEKETKEEKESSPTDYTLTPAEELPVTKPVSATLLDVSDVVEEVMPTIVAVTNTTMYSYNSGNYWNWYFGNGSTNKDYKASGAGSGVIIAKSDDELMIATNAHVVLPTDYTNYGLTAGTSEYSVKFCNDKEITAYLKGYDEAADLAVIIVKLSDVDDDTMKAIKIAAAGDSDSIKVGNGVIAIGNALGFGQSVTVGYVSALNREVKFEDNTRQLLQTDAAINPGNSGGGLFDIYGRLIGINSAKYSSQEVEGIGYAIPINTANDVLTGLMNQTTKIREKVTDEDKMCYLGISASKQYYDAYSGQGAFVEEVLEGGAAEKAGIMAYDIITSIDDVTVRTWDELMDELAYHEGGETVKVTYYTLQINGNRREYVEKECEVTLGFRKDFVEKETEKE